MTQNTHDAETATIEFAVPPLMQPDPVFKQNTSHPTPHGLVGNATLLNTSNGFAVLAENVPHNLEQTVLGTTPHLVST